MRLVKHAYHTFDRLVPNLKVACRKVHKVVKSRAVSIDYQLNRTTVYSTVFYYKVSEAFLEIDLTLFLKNIEFEFLSQVTESIDTILEVRVQKWLFQEL